MALETTKLLGFLASDVLPGLIRAAYFPGFTMSNQDNLMPVFALTKEYFDKRKVIIPFSFAMQSMLLIVLQIQGNMACGKVATEKDTSTSKSLLDTIKRTVIDEDHLIGKNLITIGNAFLRIWQTISKETGIDIGAQKMVDQIHSMYGVTKSKKWKESEENETICCETFYLQQILAHCDNYNGVVTTLVQKTVAVIEEGMSKIRPSDYKMLPAFDVAGRNNKLTCHCEKTAIRRVQLHVDSV
jgi:hypothetical protein